MTQVVSGSGVGRRIVTVQLGEEIFGLAIELIEGIVPWEPLTRVPRMPSFMAGVLNVRGSVLAIVDLRVRLGLDAPEPSAANRIVILHLGDSRVGAIVDSVKEVVWVPDDCVERSVPVVCNAHEEFIEGIANLETGLVIMLKTECLLSDSEHKKIAKLSAGAEKVAA